MANCSSTLIFPVFLSGNLSHFRIPFQNHWVNSSQIKNYTSLLSWVMEMHIYENEDHILLQRDMILIDWLDGVLRRIGNISAIEMIFKNTKINRFVYVIASTRGIAQLCKNAIAYTSKIKQKTTSFRKKENISRKKRRKWVLFFQWWHTTVKDNFVDVNFDVPTFVMKMDIYF